MYRFTVDSKKKNWHRHALYDIDTFLNVPLEWWVQVDTVERRRQWLSVPSSPEFEYFWEFALSREGERIDDYN